MPLEDRIETPKDPNAPVVLDLQLCQKLIRAYPTFGRSMHAGVIIPLGEQLKCAIAELEGIGSQVSTARNEATRYQHESNTANAEVKTMQAMLVQARDERDRAQSELAALKAPVVTEAKAEVPLVKRRGRPAKIVSITDKKVAS